MEIGLWMACFGIFNGLFQAFCFAPLVVRLGPKTLLRIGHLCFIPLFILFPVISWIARQWGINWLVWAVLICHLGLTAVMDMSFSALLLDVSASKLILRTHRLHPNVHHRRCSEPTMPRRAQRCRTDHCIYRSCYWSCVSHVVVCVFHPTQLHGGLWSLRRAPAGGHCNHTVVCYAAGRHDRELLLR